MTLQYYFVGLVFYLHLDVLGDGRVVGDVNMSIVFSLFGTMLPNMRTKNPTSRSVHNMRASVEGT